MKENSELFFHLKVVNINKTNFDWHCWTYQDLFLSVYNVKCYFLWNWDWHICQTDLVLLMWKKAKDSIKLINLFLFVLVVGHLTHPSSYKQMDVPLLSGRMALSVSIYSLLYWQEKKAMWRLSKSLFSPFRIAVGLTCTSVIFKVKGRLFLYF